MEKVLGKNIAVIGGGSWATAIVKILLENVEQVSWWVREAEIKEGVEQWGRNPLYLTSAELPKDRISITNDIRSCVANDEHLIFVVPSAFLSECLSSFKPEDFQSKRICSAIKGIVSETDQVVGEYFRDVFQVSIDDISVISGPSHAEEIALGRLTYLTSASQNREFAQDVAALFACRYVRTRISDDVFGIEYAAVVKNVYALAVGIAKGLGYGDNFAAVLVSNALSETRLFLQKVHDIHRDLSNSVYLGDLLVTSYSQFSRNRTFGNMIGSGYSVKSAILEMKMVAEGYYASHCVNKIKKDMEVPMPIFEAVHDVLYENKSARRVFAELEEKLC